MGSTSVANRMEMVGIEKKCDINIIQNIGGDTMYKKYLYAVKLAEATSYPLLPYIRGSDNLICLYSKSEAKKKCRLWHGIGIERFNYLTHVLEMQ